MLAGKTTSLTKDAVLSLDGKKENIGVEPTFMKMEKLFITIQNILHICSQRELRKL